MQLTCEEPGVDVIPSEWLADEVDAMVESIKTDQRFPAAILSDLRHDLENIRDTIGDHTAGDGTCHWTGGVDDVINPEKFTDPFQGPAFRWTCPLCRTRHTEYQGE